MARATRASLGAGGGGLYHPPHTTLEQNCSPRSSLFLYPPSREFLVIWSVNPEHKDQTDLVGVHR